MSIKDKSLAFKAYDIRGEIGVTLDEEMAKEIGMALVNEISAKRVAIGADNRPSSPALKAALIEGVRLAGAEAVDIGDTGTEQVYFSALELDIDAAIQVTASHNPIGDNGMKMILREGKPVDSAMLIALRERVVSGNVNPADKKGSLSQADIMPEYIEHLLSYIDPDILSNFKILVNPGNGMAGYVITAMEQKLKGASPFVKMHFEADSTFPNGIPNPIIPENRPQTSETLIASGADFAVAWDADFDRCFFFDENGGFIEGYYIVGLLSAAILANNPDGKIVHDPRLTWNTIEQAKRAGGEAVQAKTGHAYMKAKMREVDAVYGGEMSAHHYFRRFGYCDSGMIPWLLVTQLLHSTGKSLSTLVKEAQAAYPCSGEINFRVNDVQAAIDKVKAALASENPKLDDTDGIGMEFSDWRMNIRASNTEPLLRLNIESRGNPDLVSQKLALISQMIETA